METGPDATHEARSDNLPDEPGEIIVCPNCEMEGPRGIYCNNCGYPLYVEYDEKSDPAETEDGHVEESLEAVEAEAPGEILVEPEAPPVGEEVRPHEEMVSHGPEEGAEPAEDTILDSVRARARNLVRRYGGYWKGPTHQNERDERIHGHLSPEGGVEDSSLGLLEAVEGDMIEGDAYDTETPDSVEGAGRVEPRGHAPGSTQAFDQDPILRDVMESLVRSISMELWLLDRLMEGEIEEGAFNELLEDYSSRTAALITSRRELLEGARDMGAMERTFTQARLRLEELEMRRDIGYISEEEYRAKAPGFEWDVEKYGEEISRRRAEAAFLEDLSNIVSVEEIGRMREKAENLRDGLTDLERSRKVSPETAETARESLDRILDCLEGSGSRENHI